MTELTAYVSGDAAVVTQLLSQVAMVMNGGSFETGVKLFALIGILLGLFGALMKGGKLSAEIFVMPIFVVAFGIVPKVDLVIEDPAGGLSKIDNLPVIAAAPVSLVTNIGHALNIMLTDNLGLDDTAISMQNGHIVKVRAPLAIQEVMLDPELNDEFAELPGGIDITTDIPRYVGKCVGYNQRHGSAPPAVLFNGNVNTVFAVANRGFTVETSTGGSLPCDTYFENIMTGIESAEFENGLKAVLNRQFARYKNDEEIGGRYIAALDEIMASRTDFYKTILFSYAIKKARADYTRAGGGGSSYMALQDAMDQRQWSNFGAASMVFETLQHMTTFIEGWTLCVLPLIALLFVAGANGMKLGIKYFWLLVWTQLWYPTILITIGILDAYAKGAYTSTYSVAQMASFLEEMHRLQDVGYLFLSLTTMMSIFLIYGSSAYLAGSFQSDMTATQHYDPKKNAPDSIQRDPHTVFERSFGYTDAGGYAGNVKSLANVQFTLDTQRSEGVTDVDLATFARTGTRGVTSSASTGDQARTEQSAFAGTAATSSASATQSARSSDSFRTDLESGAGLTAGGSESRGMQSSVQTGVYGSGTGAIGSLIGTAGRLLSAAESGGATGSGNSASGMGGGLPADIRGSAALIRQDGVSRSMGAVDRMGGGRDLSSSSEASAAHVETTGLASTQSEQDTAAVTTTTLRQETAAQSAQEAMADSDSRAITEQMSAGSGGRVTVGGIEVANAIARDRGLMNNLVRDTSMAGISHKVDDYLLRHEDLLDKAFMGPDAGDAKYAFSSMMVMQGMGGSPYAGELDAAERMAALNAMGDEYLYAVTYGEGTQQYGDLRDANSASADAIDLSNRIDNVHMRVTMTEEGVEEALSTIDPDLSPKEAFAEMMRRTAPRLDDLTEGQASGVFSEIRQNINTRFGEEMENAKPLAQKLAESGVRGYLRGLTGNSVDVNAAQNADAFQNVVARSGGLGEASAEDILATRQEDFRGAGAHEDDPIARYMALYQLETGARAAAGGLASNLNTMIGGDSREDLTDLADTFQGMREALIGEHPQLSNEAEKTEIGALAIIASGSDMAFARTYPAAQMLGDVAAEEHRYEAMTGNEISRDASAIDWDLTSSQGNNYTNDRKGIVGGIHDAADALGIEPMVLATAISYETAGSFDPTKEGPITQHGQHRGLIQFGERQARENGVDWGDPVNSQLGADGAVVSYLRDAGVQPGASLLEVYSAINAGGVGESFYSRSDSHNGGMPGTVRDKVASREMEEHRQNAVRFMNG